jgi:ankyrin repeat protein
LLYATLSGRTENIQALLAAGASVNAADDSGRTPAAHAAASPIDARILKALLDAGADPDTGDIAG